MTGLGIAPELLGNPHWVPVELDRVLPIPPDVPGYSETCFLSTWNPDVRVGQFVHAGRSPQDINLWWAQVLAYLPDGTVAADRSWGRSNSPDILATGNLTVRMGEAGGGWTASFDGAAQLTTPARMAAGPVGAGPARAMTWTLRTVPAGPMWDLYVALGKGSAGTQDWAQGSHTQQVLTVTGQLIVDGVKYSLDGVAGNDHSSGPRDVSALARHHFLVGSLPGRALHCLSLFAADGTAIMDSGTEFRAGNALTTVTLIDVPPLAAADGTPRDFEAALTYADGSRVPVVFETLATAPVSLNSHNDNVNGMDTDSAETLVMSESRVRLTLPDGAVGYGNLERSALRSLLVCTS
jgi:hypothetical protein